MITRPVALTRAVLLTALVWGAGAGITIAAFHLLGSSTTISDVATNRTQIIWFGSHALCACVGALLGTSLAGTALTRAFVSEPLPAAVSVAVPVVVLGLVVVAVLDGIDAMGNRLAVANLIGLAIGVVCGCVYVVATGLPDERPSVYGTPRQASRSWGSR